MYEVFENVINKGDFNLEMLLKRIDTYHIEGKLTGEQRAALVTLARQKADPNASFAGWQDEAKALAASIRAVSDALAALTLRVEGLEKGTPTPPPAPEDPPAEINSNGTVAWSEYVPPTGAHNAYNKGDKITFKGERYISNADSNVWSPFAYPDYWTKQV